MKKIIFFYILFFYNSESIAASQDIKNSDTARAPLRTMKNLSEEELIEIAVRESQKDHEEWQEARREEQEALHARWPMQREQLSRQHLEASATQEEEQVAQAIALSLREASIQEEASRSPVSEEDFIEESLVFNMQGLQANREGLDADEIHQVSNFFKERSGIKSLTVKNLKAPLFIGALKCLHEERFIFSSLTNVDLANNSYVPFLFKIISLLAPKLTGLTVNNCNLGVDDARAIYEIMPQLRTLDISFNGIGDRGAATIAQMPYLTTLDVRSNGIGSSGAAAIAQMPHLKDLDIRFNKIAPSGETQKAEVRLQAAAENPIERENRLAKEAAEAGMTEQEKKELAEAMALSLREASIQGGPVHSQIPVEEAMETGNGLEQEGAAAEGAGPEARIRTAQEEAEAEDPIAMILQKSRQEYEEHQKVVKKEEEELAQALAASILEEQYYNNIRYTHVNWLNEEALSLANIGGEENLRTAEGLLLEALDIDQSTKTRSSMSVIQKKLHVESLNKQALNISGIGGKENLETAVALLGEALAIEDAIQTWYNFGLITRQLDPKKSRMCFKIAAERGHVLAQTLYGVMLNQGKGGPKNDTEARKFFQLAANSGEKMSHYNYAIMLLRGYGGAQDLVEGERYMEMASKNESNPQAQYHYGILLSRKGTQESKQEALKYIKKAADKGHKLALETLEKLKKETPEQKASSENLQEPTLSEVVKPQLGEDLEPAGDEPRTAYPKEAPESLEEQDDISTSTEEEEKEAYEGVRQMGAVFPAKPKKTTSEREQAKREINRKKKIVLDALRQGSREEIAEARKKLTDIDDSTFRGWVRDAYEKIGKERTKVAIQAIRQKALEGEANLTSSASAAPLDRADERKEAAPKSRKKLDKKTENAHQKSSPQTERAELSPKRNTQFYPLTYSAQKIAEHMTDPGKSQTEPKVGVQKEIDDLFENMKQNWHAITGLWGRLGGSFDQSGGTSHGRFKHSRFGSAHGFGYHMHGRDGLHPGLILDLRSYILLIGYRPSNFSHELEFNS